MSQMVLNLGNFSHDNLSQLQSSTSLREYGRYGLKIEAPKSKFAQQYIMEELANINARLKKINDEYSEVFENETKDITSAEEDFKAYIARKRGNIHQREMTMLKEVQEQVDKMSDQKIRKQLTTFIKDYSVVVQALRSQSKEKRNVLEELSNWITGERFDMTGVMSDNIIVAEKAEENMRVSYMQIIKMLEKLKSIKTEMDNKAPMFKKGKKWKDTDSQSKPSPEEPNPEVQFQGMDWQELTSYMVNFAKENFADSPDITRMITDYLTEATNIVKSKEEEIEKMKAEIKVKSVQISKLSKKTFAEEKEVKGPPADPNWKKSPKGFNDATKKGLNEEEGKRIEPGIVTVFMGQQNEPLRVGGGGRSTTKNPGEQFTTNTQVSVAAKPESIVHHVSPGKMEPTELQQLLRAHIDTSINHIKAISKELLRLRKAARCDIETIKSKEMDVHEVEQKLKELIGVVNPDSLPEVKKTDDALIVRSRAPGTHTCNYCECHKMTKSTVVAKVDTKTSMDQVNDHCSLYLQMLGETEQVFKKAIVLLTDIQKKFQHCQSHTMWKKGNIFELSILNPVNDNEILEQVNNAQDIPETTNGLIEHANNCFKLLQVFYKDLEFLIQLSGKCVDEVAEQDERLREMNTLLSNVKDLVDRKGLDMARLKYRENRLQTMDILAGRVCPYCHCTNADSAKEKPRPKHDTPTKDELLSSLKKGDSVKAKVDLMIDALGAILKEVDENAGKQGSQSKEEEKMRKEAVEAMQEARRRLEKASQQAPCPQTEVEGPEADDVICVNSLTTTDVTVRDVSLEDSREQGMRVELDGDQDDERGERSKKQRLLVTSSPGGKSSTGKEQVSHRSVTHATESSKSPTKDSIRRLSTIGAKERKEKPTNWKEADGSKKTASQRKQSTNFVSSSPSTSLKTTPEAQVKGKRRRSKVSESKAMPENESTAEAEVRQKDDKEEGNLDIKVEVEGDREFLENPVETVLETQGDTNTTFSKANSGAAVKRKSSVVASTDKVAKSKGKDQKKSTKVRKASYSPEVRGRKEEVEDTRVTDGPEVRGRKEEVEDTRVTDGPEVRGRKEEVEDTRATDGQPESDILDVSQPSVDMMSTQERLEQDIPEDEQKGFQKEEWRPEQTSCDSGVLGNASEGEIEQTVTPDSFAYSSLPRDSSTFRPDLEEQIFRSFVEATFDDTLISLRERTEYDTPDSEYLQSKLVKTSEEALTRKVQDDELQRNVKGIAAEMEEFLVKSTLKPEPKLYGERTQQKTSYPAPSTTHSLKHRVHDTLAHQSYVPIRLTEYDSLRAKTKSPKGEMKESGFLATGLLRNLQPTCIEKDYYRPAEMKARIKKIIRIPSIDESIPDEEVFMSFGTGTEPSTGGPTGKGTDKYRKNNDLSLNPIRDIALSNLPSLVGHDSMSTWKVLELNSTPGKKPDGMNTLKQRVQGKPHHDSLFSRKGESRGKIGNQLPGLATLMIAGVGQASPESYVSQDLSLKIRKMQEEQTLPPLKGKSLYNKSTFLSLTDPLQKNRIMGESDAWILTQIPETEADRKRSHVPRLPLQKDKMPSLSRKVQISVRGSRPSPSMTLPEESLMCLLCYCKSQGVREKKRQSLLGREGKRSLSSTFQTTPESCLCSLVPFSAGTFQYCQLGYSPHFAQALCGSIKKKCTPKKSSHKSLFGHLYKPPASLGPHRYDLCVRNSTPGTVWNYHPAITGPQLSVKYESDVLPEKESKDRGI